MPADVVAIFYVGNVPWHGRGVRLEAPMDLATALARGGLDWTARLRPVFVEEDPPTSTGRRAAVVRDDIAPSQAGCVLGIVHPGFHPLQNPVVAVGEDVWVDTYVLYRNSQDGSQAVDMRISTVRLEQGPKACGRCQVQGRVSECSEPLVIPAGQ